MTMKLGWYGALIVGACVGAGCSSSDSSTAAPQDGGVADGSSTSAPVDGGTVVSTTDGGVSTSAAATFNGSIDGYSLTPHDAFAYFNSHDTGATEQDVTIWIADFTGACTLAQTNVTKQGGKALKIQLMPTAAAVPGTYPLATKSTASGPYAEISVKQYDASCNNVTKSDDDKVQAGSGTVTLTAVSTTEAVGSFSLLVDGVAVTGTFTAPMCANADTSTASSSCAP